MRIIALRTLKAFWEKHPDSEEHLKAWYQVVRNAEWKNPQDVKAQYRNASILQDGRAVFNIRGNQYRLVVWINYEFFTVYVRFIGTHKEYDDTDVQNI